MGFVYQFAYFMTSGALYKTLLITAPLVWIDIELAASVLGIIAPVLFLVATVIIDLLPVFTKKAKKRFNGNACCSYALYWILGFAADAYFRV
ncbi:MAG: hypothetical protein ACI4LB_07480 [Candidatus Fimenecus sp.]